MTEPRIVVLDGYTLNPCDLSWDGLKSLGSCEIYDRTPPEETRSRSEGADILLTNKTVLDADTIAVLEQLRYVGVLATGFNVVDVDATRERCIPVANVPTYGTNSVAQMVFAHLLNLAQPVEHHAEAVRQGRWSSAVDWCFWDTPLLELAGLTMGIIGLGRIGRATARLAHAFEMSVLAYDSFQGDPPDYVRFVDLETLFRESDVLSLHCPLNPQTEGIVSRERLATMKSTALLINTSRGPLVDQHALADALNSGQIAGAGLDVLAGEPPARVNPLLTAKNCQITPHIAWATRASRARLLETAVANVAAFLAGRPQNVVNGVA